jgi:hypothetical protein
MHHPRGDRARIQGRSRNIKMRPRWFNLDWILSFFVVTGRSHPANQPHEGVDLVRNSRPVGTEILLQANSAKERDDQAGERIIIVTSSARCGYTASFSTCGAVFPHLSRSDCSPACAMLVDEPDRLFVYGGRRNIDER